MHPPRRTLLVTDSGTGTAGKPAQPGGQMMLMLLMMLFMMMLIMNPGIREALKTYADPVLSPIVPQNSLILMVFILGSASMVVNTILRSFFMDPVAQAHIAHRQRQIGKMANEARMDQDKVAQDTAMRMREMMMPDQMAVQMGAFKPMMFTMVFIIAIFSWLAETVTNFRVEYLSLPWVAKWPLNDRVMWIFPVWIFAYIAMSAPLGRIIDRHIKLARYTRHPIVAAGETIQEPLLDQFRQEKKSETKRGSRRGAAKRRQAKETAKKAASTQPFHQAAPMKGECPACGSEDIERGTSGSIRCTICRSEWR